MAASKNTETNAAETEKVARPRLSPQEKAVKDLAKAEARYAKATEKRAGLDGKIEAADTEVAEAERYLTFAQGSRHLPAQAQDEVASEPVQDEELFTTSS